MKSKSFILLLALLSQGMIYFAQAACAANEFENANGECVSCGSGNFYDSSSTSCKGKLLFLIVNLLNVLISLFGLRLRHLLSDWNWQL